MKIKSIITTIILAVTLTTTIYAEPKQFAQEDGTGTGTDVVDVIPHKEIKVKESKLTNLRYLKKISNLVSEEPIVVVRTGKVNKVYKFESEGIKGYLQVAPNGKDKLAVFKINGELYGRVTWMTREQIYLRMNLHDSMVKQRVYISDTYQTKKGGVTYERYHTSRFTEYGLGKRSREMKDTMLRYAKAKGLL